MSDNTPMRLKQPETATPVSWFEALVFWFKLGWISFGGPAAQIAIMHQELVERRRWISEKRFLHALNYCMILPGPEAQQLATYLGWLMHKSWGGVIAGLLFILPALFILMLLGWLYMAFGQLAVVQGLLYTLKPTVIAIVFLAAYRMASRSLSHPYLVFIAVLAFLAIFFAGLPFPMIITLAALIGALGGHYWPEVFARQSAHATHYVEKIPALIDDETPIPEHARWKLSRFVLLLLIGLLLWGGVMAVLCIQFGAESVLSQLGWFFTKVAWVTFGGAYAALPYVQQAVVEAFHWLSAGQMMDALALGETTPGPLIMVFSFAGFVIGWKQAVFGPDQLLWSAVCATLIVTYFSFLPSFIMILLGGPLIESTQHNLRVRSPLTGISAAVVGVIVNLAVLFAVQVFWPENLHGQFDGLAASLAAIAFLLMFRFKLGVIQVIISAGILGGLASVLLPLWAS